MFTPAVVVRFDKNPILLMCFRGDTRREDVPELDELFGSEPTCQPSVFVRVSVTNTHNSREVVLKVLTHSLVL